MSDTSSPFSDQFSEFPSVGRSEWLAAIGENEQKTGATADHGENIKFSVINTKDRLPSSDVKGGVAYGGATAMEVTLDELPTLEALKSLQALGVDGLYGSADVINGAVGLLPDLDESFNQVSLEASDSSPDALLPYLNYFRNALGAERSTQGTIYLPVTRYDQWKKGDAGVKSVAKLIGEIKDLPALRVVSVTGNTFYELGASVVDELAMTLSWWVAYCDRITDEGVSMEEIVQRSEITLALGDDLFLELAKFRAIRFLVGKIGEAYGLKADHPVPPLVRAISGKRNKTFYDPDSNILRNTTEALAARLGGADTLSLLPHDFLYPPSGDFGRRTAIQLNNVLHYEAHVGKVTDPAAGSYFIEDITRQLVDKSWTLFLQFEEQGGFQHLVSSGSVEERCQQYHREQTKRVNRQTKVVVGANRYTNPLESAAVSLDQSGVRLASPVEQIRHEMDMRVSQGGAKPMVHLWIQQNSSSDAIINQRVNYIKDLLNSVGFAWEEFAFTNEDNYIAALAASTHPNGIVFCGTNAFYETTIISLLKSHQLPTVRQFVAGGQPAIDEAILQAGGGGVLGIGYDVISRLKPLIKPTPHEA